MVKLLSWYVSIVVLWLQEEALDHWYFYSITRKTFRKGIGIAFNNSTKEFKPIIIKNSDLKIKIKILRGEGVFTSDNSHKKLMVNPNDTIEIIKLKKCTSVLQLEKSKLEQSNLPEYANKEY